MVYYHTSKNVRMMRNILMDFSASSEVSPYEYMKMYIDKCPDTSDDSKISWIAETFLGIQKHGQFLKEIASHMSNELSEEDQDYFMIIFHSIIFLIEPKDTQLLYKCLFNLSKPLLYMFTKFLSNNEVLTFISQIAQSMYDMNYITEKIINPLFTWQPYISEMGHTYAEYVTKLESRKLKPPTIPIQPNVLNKRTKEHAAHSNDTPLPVTPPNSFQIKKRMLTKSAIDRRLKSSYEKNKQRAANVLSDIRNKNFHYAQPKSEKYYNIINNIKGETENEFTKPLPKSKHSLTLSTKLPPVKDTVANLKRTNRRIQIVQAEEVEWLETLLTTCRNTAKINEMEEFYRQERERERLLDIEKKHLMGLISYEEAVISKKKLLEENKKKYEKFLKEKDIWNQEIEKWRKLEIEKNRKQFEKLSLIQLNLIQARNGVISKKKEIANNTKKESEMLIANAVKAKQEELDHRVKMIKEIKILATIAKAAKVPKIIDLTETSGLGLLCEMSIAELQERLSAFKIGLYEELERKKTMIKQDNLAMKQELKETKLSINKFMAERAAMRKQNQKSKITFDNISNKEINDLKKTLDEKRKLRTQLTKSS
ncbi:unnamed protein product [Diatraea saccharalis]|uniref:Cilia- and flagella-associated protein 99-like n=1 Tax=Diatraea saccharalis TaxID=40085 RepID=A0A9P0G3G9_9NEOP|nr:unnamed protein product [Diatraea saccharalis]